MATFGQQSILSDPVAGAIAQDLQILMSQFTSSETELVTLDVYVGPSATATSIRAVIYEIATDPAGVSWGPASLVEDLGEVTVSAGGWAQWSSAGSIELTQNYYPIIALVANNSPDYRATLGGGADISDIDRNAMGTTDPSVAGPATISFTNNLGTADFSAYLTTQTPGGGATTESITGTSTGTSTDSGIVTTVGTTISGTVTLGGSGVGSALVYLIDQSTDGVYDTTTTAGDGTYSFVNVPSGTYHVVVESGSGSAPSIPNLVIT